MDFIDRGGTVMSSRRIWPAVTASRYSHSRSMCQFGRNGVSGSRIPQACSTYRRNEPSAAFVSNASLILTCSINASVLVVMVRHLGGRCDLDDGRFCMRGDDGLRRQEASLARQFGAKVRL